MGDGWRTYDVPYLPEGSGWVVRYEVMLDGRVERRVSDLLTPDSVHLALPAWLEPEHRAPALPSSCRVEGRRRLHIHLSDALHDRLADVLGAASWSVVDLRAHLQARELLAMLEGPAPHERRWAQREIQRASREVCDVLTLFREHDAWLGSRATPAAAPAAWQEPPWLLTACAFTGPRGLWRDVGVDFGKACRGAQESPSGSRWSYLDDTQLEVLTRAGEKREWLRDWVQHEQTVRPGQPIALDLGPVGYVSLEALAVSSNRRFLTVQVAVRRLDGSGMRFIPHRRWTLPNRGCIFLHPADLYGEAREPADAGYVLITLEAPDGLHGAPYPVPVSDTLRGR